MGLFLYVAIGVVVQTVYTAKNYEDLATGKATELISLFAAALLWPITICVWTGEFILSVLLPWVEPRFCRFIEWLRRFDQ